MAAAGRVLSEQDLDAAARLADELERSGRVDEAVVLLKLIAQAAAAGGESAPLEEDLPAEDIEAIERGLADVAAARLVPHAMVMRGPAAVEAYRHRRDTGSPTPVPDA